MGREGIWEALEEGKSTIKTYLNLKIVLSNKKNNRKEKKTMKGPQESVLDKSLRMSYVWGCVYVMVRVCIQCTGTHRCAHIGVYMEV